MRPRVHRVRERGRSTARNERVHLAGGVEPTMRERRIVNARLAHELAEVRLDTGRLLEAHQMRDYRHLRKPVMGTGKTGTATRWWAV